MEIPKVKLVTQPETNEAKEIVGYKWNEVAGTRHFLGGKPDGLAESEYPTCEGCKKTMTFYAQVDCHSRAFATRVHVSTTAGTLF